MCDVFKVFISGFIVSLSGQLHELCGTISLPFSLLSMPKPKEPNQSTYRALSHPCHSIPAPTPTQCNARPRINQSPNISSAKDAQRIFIHTERQENKSKQESAVTHQSGIKNLRPSMPSKCVSPYRPVSNPCFCLSRRAAQIHAVQTQPVRVRKQTPSSHQATRS